jgi:alpha-1,6-mannosyltransferase
VLVFAVGGAHNEALMMLAALGGVYLLLAGREAGTTAIVGAAAVKLSAAVLLPFAVLGSRRPGRALVWAAAAAAAVAGISLLLFGPQAVSFVGVLGETRALATPNDVPGVLNDLLGLGLSTETLGTVGNVALALVLALLLVRVHRGGDWLENAAWATLAMIATTTWLLPWYLVWFLPLAALARAPYQRLAGLALTALVIGLLLPPLAGA